MGISLGAWSTGATVAAAVAAMASGWAAFKSNSTSNSLAKIERDRRHQELRPQFTVECEKYSDSIFYLILTLDGPDGLNQIDSFKVSIRNNKNMDPGLSGFPTNPEGKPTKQDIENQIWAPFRFSPNVDGSSTDGRSIPHSVLKLGDECRFQLERTPVPYWNTTGGDRWWTGQGISAYLKISIECQKADLEPWVIPWRKETPLEKIA